MHKFKLIRNIVFLSLLILASCSPSEEISGVLIRRVINKTDKRLIIEIETDVSKKERASSLGSDSVSLRFMKKSKSESLLFGLASTEAPRVYIKSAAIYNITDTTMFQERLETDTSPYTENDHIYARHLKRGLNEGTYQHAVITEDFYFTDSIVDIMQKDYSMLQKFNEYYK